MEANIGAINAIGAAFAVDNPNLTIDQMQAYRFKGLLRFEKEYNPFRHAYSSKTHTIRIQT